MEREDAKFLLPVIQAYANGEEIQYNVDDEWVDVTDGCDFYDHPLKYRIKPKEEYRPYKTLDDVIERIDSHIPHSYVKLKSTGVLYQIKSINPNLGKALDVNDICYNLEEMFDKFTWGDNKPFGERKAD